MAASNITATTATVSAKHKAFVLPFDPALYNLVPQAKQFSAAAGPMMAIPHQIDTVKLARNMGYRVQSPIVARYDWNGDKPWRSQKITAALLTMNKRAYVLSDMGTGKTRSALHAVNFLLQEGTIHSALVIAPLSTLWNVWDTEVLRYFNHLSVGVLHGTRQKRIKKLAEPHDIYVINHDGVATILPQLLERPDIDCIVCDELGFLRTPNTDRWKTHRALFSGRQYVWGLTGSPTPNEPCDAWAQCQLLTPHSVPKHFLAFKRQTMRQVSQFKWIERDDAKDIVYAAMQPAVRFKRSDCAEIPPVSYQTVPVALSASQDNVYKTMMKKLTVAFSKGEVTAANEGVLFSKLLQIASGWVYTADRGVVNLNNTSRIQALFDILSSSEGKVIVFAEFIHAAQALQSLLSASLIDCELVTGQTPGYLRADIFRRFQDYSSPRVLVAHPRCMAHGLTLTSASTIVWFTPTTSLETYEQACARITRPGQLMKQLIVHLTGTPVETKLYRRLQHKKSLQGALLEMFEQEPE
jgi:SNF2 family DNA or RNA helicase